MMSFRKKMSPRMAAVVAIASVAVVGGAAALGATGDATGLPGASLARIVVGTLIAFGLLLLAAKWLPKFGGIGGIRSDSFRVVAALPVGQRERVVIVQVGDQQVMLGVAPGRVGMIRELDEPLAERDASAASMAGMTPQNWLNRVIGKQS